MQRVVNHFLYKQFLSLINFRRPPVTQGLLALFLILIDLSGACRLLVLLKECRNLVKLSFASLHLNTGDQSSHLCVSQKAFLSNFLKSLISIISGKGLSVGS